jgi:hypothetical protein
MISEALPLQQHQQQQPMVACAPIVTLYILVRDMAMVHTPVPSNLELPAWRAGIPAGGCPHLTTVGWHFSKSKQARVLTGVAPHPTAMMKEDWERPVSCS